MSLDMETIILFQPRHFDTMRAIRRGALDVALEEGHVLLTMKQTMNRAELQSVLNAWKPAGCIIDCSDGNDILPLDPFAKIHHICLNLPDRPEFRRHNAFNHDTGKIVSLAFSELQGMGLDHFAYVPCSATFPWSVERGVLFKKMVTDVGKSFVHHRQESLENWLKTLRLPCGVFAANDEVAQSVVVSCAHVGLNVPNDIAIVGVDNDELYCEASMPGITSVETDFYQAGRRLCQMLIERIAHPTRKVLRERYGPSRIVRRGSTRKLTQPDPRVLLALECFRRHACCGPLKVEMIAKTMNCSYRLATEEFRQVTGHSIVEEIHRTRFERLCEQLSTTDAKLSELIFGCGYNSESFAKHEFKRRYGLSMSAWRKQSRSAGTGCDFLPRNANDPRS